MNKSKKILVSKGRKTRTNSYVECKFVLVVEDEREIMEIRDALQDALEERGWLYSDKILMASIQMCADEEHPSSVAVVVITKRDVRDINDITDEIEAEDKAFLNQITETLDGWYPKIYYTTK